MQEQRGGGRPSEGFSLSSRQTNSGKPRSDPASATVPASGAAESARADAAQGLAPDLCDAGILLSAPCSLRLHAAQPDTRTLLPELPHRGSQPSNLQQAMSSWGTPGAPGD